MTGGIMSNIGRIEIKICRDCWYYKPAPAKNKILENPESANKFPCCDFYNNFSSVKPDDTCENWESNKLRLINVIKVLYGV
jgi:hypothetical protein